MNFKNIENITILTIAIFVIIISLFDIFGLLDIPIIKDKTPQIILLLLGILLGYIIKFQRRKIEKVEGQLKNIHARQIQNGLDQFENHENGIHPLFKKIFSDKISESFHFIRDLINSNTITVYDLSRFKYYYKLIIEENTKKEFFATSIPSPNYVWDSSSSLNPLEQAMKTHIKNKGKFTRIIFIEENEAESDLVKFFSNKQRKMGVKLFYVNISKVPKRLQKNFFYIKNEDMICEGFLNKSGELSEVKIEISKEKSRNFKMIFKELMSNHC